MPKKRIKWTHELVQQWLDENTDGYKLVSQFERTDRPVDLQCSNGHNWTARPHNILHSNRTSCPDCSLERRIKWTKDACKSEALKYPSRSEWERGSSGSYDKARKMGWLEECCEHMGPPRKVGQWQIKGNVLEAARQSVSRTDFYRRFSGAAFSAKKNGWLEECLEILPQSKTRELTDEVILESARRYNTIVEWQRADPSAQKTARNRSDEFFARCTAHMECGIAMGIEARRKWTRETCLADAANYKSIADWNRGNASAYNAARHGGWLEECRVHMDRMNGSDNDAVYVYEIGDALGWTGLHKTGLTSWKLGDERIKQTNRDNGTDYRIVALIRTTKGDAPKIERAILDSGEPFADLPDTFVDGRTEVRRFGPRAMESINQLAQMSGYKEAL